MAPTVALLAAVQLALASPAGAGPEVRVEREAWAMGTRLHVVAEAPAGAARPATEAVLREVERLEALLSTWDPTTETSVLNGAPVGEPRPLSPELHALLAEAAAWSRTTGGAFDPVVGALVDAWDLRGEGRVPGPSELAAARAATGPEALAILPDGAAVRHHPDAWLDTGGFGKGAALRSAAALLDEAGARRARVDLGGQLWLAAPADEPWRVRVAHPADRTRPAADPADAPWAELVLHDVSVATSGTSERWVEVDGERLGHILDPRTGRPAPAWGTVTVVHPDPVAADVLATALYVLGPVEGPRWLERHHPGIAALFLEHRDDAVIPRWTGAMEPWLAGGALPEEPARPASEKSKTTPDEG